MNEWREALRIARMAVVAGMLVPSSIAWAQPLEVSDPSTVTSEVTTQVDRLVVEVAARDPELAQEIGRQRELCLRDISDGKLDAPEFTHEVDSLREVQREVTGRVVQREVEARIAEATAKGNTELAEKMRTAFEAMRGAPGAEAAMGHPELGGTEGGPGEMIGRADAKAMFEQAYTEVVKTDPDGAARMKEMFESAERGEFVRPTPEMMEHMRSEMEHFVSEHPEKSDYARAEWDRFVDSGPDRGERYGPTETTEQQREAFERWATDTGSTGRSQTEIDQIRGDFERSLAKGENPWEHTNELGGPERTIGPEREYVDPREVFDRWAGSEEGRNTSPEAVERYRDIAERQSEFERYAPERTNEAILDNRAEMTQNTTPPPSQSEGAHTLVQDLPGPDSMWDGADADTISDHMHPDGFGPHTGS